jgi:DNA repair protein RecO (recombination protein O)
MMQRVYKTHAVVLKRIAVGETDKIVTLFTREYGKLNAIAKGARRTTSRLVGGTEPLTYSRMLLAVGQNLDVLTQCEVQEAFLDLRRDLPKLGHATYLIELTNAAVEERQPHPELFDLLLTALYVLERVEAADIAARMFELKAMRLLGYEPQLDRCVLDRASLAGPRFVFSPSRGGMLCPRCAGEGGSVISLTTETLAHMRRLMAAEAREVPQIHPTEAERSQMARALTAYVRARLEAPLRSLHFIEELKIAGVGAAE